MESEIATEQPWLWGGMAAYAFATGIAFWGALRRQKELKNGLVATHSHENIELAALVTGVVLLFVCLTLRWLRIDHGPFVNLYELLISQLFSLGLIYSLVYWRWPSIRPVSLMVLPVIWVLGSWVLTLEPTAHAFPPTYYNPWLWAHVGSGKIFLGILLVATGLAGVLLIRNTNIFRNIFHTMPESQVLEALAWRFMVLALIFDSLMLVFGAVWAQDAWGRFWKWDALETSAFLTWLAIGIAIHIRLSYRMPRKIGAIFIIAIFCLAFATYFSTPFVSEAAHKGVI